MSSCEKCWRDAREEGESCVVDRYHALMRERRSSPCSPEEQAGPEAWLCPICNKRTLHQYTREPMCGCKKEE